MHGFVMHLVFFQDNFQIVSDVEATVIQMEEKMDSLQLGGFNPSQFELFGKFENLVNHLQEIKEKLNLFRSKSNRLDSVEDIPLKLEQVEEFVTSCDHVISSLSQIQIHHLAVSLVKIEVSLYSTSYRVR